MLSYQIAILHGDDCEPENVFVKAQNPDGACWEAMLPLTEQEREIARIVKIREMVSQND